MLPTLVLAVFLPLAAASRCQVWLETDPTRCTNPMYLQWCKFTAPQICKAYEGQISQKLPPTPVPKMEPYLTAKETEELQMKRFACLSGNIEKCEQLSSETATIYKKLRKPPNRLTTDEPSTFRQFKQHSSSFIQATPVARFPSPSVATETTFHGIFGNFGAEPTTTPAPFQQLNSREATFGGFRTYRRRPVNTNSLTSPSSSFRQAKPREISLERSAAVQETPLRYHALSQERSEAVFRELNSRHSKAKASVATEFSEERDRDAESFVNDLTKENVMFQCALDQHVSQHCLEFATFKIDLIKMLCEKPFCFTHLSALNYCQKNLKNNNQCCRQLDPPVPLVCLEFCNGQSRDIRLSQMMHDIHTANIFLECFAHFDRIQWCNQREHSGVKETEARYWLRDRMGNEVSRLLRLQECHSPLA